MVCISLNRMYFINLTLNSGWSFEIDEEDVNKLLEKENIAEPDEKEERTALEDVFR